MAAALRLGRSHLGQTSSNPSVGCVIVKDGEIVGEAVTAVGGRPHAETQALAMAGPKAHGATAYVTLEPCSHHGKTPPCANALVAAGVARVVIAVEDPDPRVSGRGTRILREAGIEVVTGVLAQDARRHLAGYLMRHIQKRVHVTLKLAVSADGMLGRKGQGQVAITGPISRAQVQLLRAETDAILVGIGTARADDPELTVRLTGMAHLSPLRIVLDRRLELPLTSRLVTGARQFASVCACCGGQGFLADDGQCVRAAALAEKGVEIIEMADVPELLAHLAARGLSTLMVEGGAMVAKTFLDQGLVDRIHLYEGADLIGAEGIASPLTRANIPKDFVLSRRTSFGADRFHEYERDF